MTKAKNETPIDRTAEELQPVAAPPPAAPAEPADVPMPAAENAPPCLFKPSAAIGTTDVLEIALAYLLHLTNAQFDVAPGALRQVPLPATRVAQLSESARRFMQPVSPQ